MINPAWAQAPDYLHLDWVDLKVDPKIDFYHYANQNWQRANPIPATELSWGTLAVLEEANTQLLKKMVLALAKSQTPLSKTERRLKDYYVSGMDQQSQNSLGVSPLKAEFAKIDSIQNDKELQTEVAHLQMLGIMALFSMGEMQALQDNRQVIAVADQARLSLPNREYYLSKQPQFVNWRLAFKKHVSAMFKLLGSELKAADKAAALVLNIETQLAQASQSPAQRRDLVANYHLLSLPQIQALTPNFSWPQYFADLGHPQLKQINLAAPEYFKRLNVLLKSIPLTDWKTYLRWRLVHNTGAYLSQPYFDESFRFYAQLTGAKQPLPKWKRVITSENSDLAFALGQLYVQQVFGQASKQEVMQMVRNIQATLDSDLQHLSWMTPKTRKAAQLKLKSMTFRIGYPDKWMDYSKLEINAGPWVLNHLRASQFLMEFELNKIGKPVDKSEWVMPPQTVNAYYDPAQNTMNFPAGILQPPFFDPQAPASVNYGAIGVIIGHEMTHGFDDQGAKFDEKGNLNTWWSAEDEQRFDEKVACISDQFSKYKVQGLAVVGQLVAGEALADLGGTVLAYRALHRSMGGKTAPFIQGLSPDQQFFLSSAHVWAANIRPEAEVSHVLSDPHPPLVFRINGTFSNLSEFAQAYGVRAPSAMINPRRCDLW